MSVKVGNKYLANIPEAVSFLLNKKVKATSIEVNPDNEAEFRLVITFEDDSTIESEYLAIEPNIRDLKANPEDNGKYLACKVVDGEVRIVARSVAVGAIEASEADVGKVLTVDENGFITPEEASGGGTKLYKHILQLDINEVGTEELTIINNSSSPITSLSNVSNIINGQVSDSSDPDIKYYTFMNITVEPDVCIIFGTYQLDISYGFTLGTDNITEL